MLRARVPRLLHTPFSTRNADGVIARRWLWRASWWHIYGPSTRVDGGSCRRLALTRSVGPRFGSAGVVVGPLHDSRGSAPVVTWIGRVEGRLRIGFVLRGVGAAWRGMAGSVRGVEFAEASADAEGPVGGGFG